MSSFNEDKAFYKEMQRERYGYYCNKVRLRGEIPVPYHKWQDMTNPDKLPPPAIASERGIL
jgi:hypothetical protein